LNQFVQIVDAGRELLYISLEIPLVKVMDHLLQLNRNVLRRLLMKLDRITGMWGLDERNIVGVLVLTLFI